MFKFQLVKSGDILLLSLSECEVNSGFNMNYKSTFSDYLLFILSQVMAPM